jgi:hypothetical protein
MTLTGKVVPYKVGFGAMMNDVFHVPFPVDVHGITVEMALDVLGAVLAMACLRAARHDEALRFPQPQRRGRDAGEPCGLRYLVMNGFVRTHHAKSPILSYRPLIAPLAECAGISKIAVAFLQKKCRNST